MVEIEIEDSCKNDLGLDEPRKSLAVNPSDGDALARSDEAKKLGLNRSGKGKKQQLAVQALRDVINAKGTHWRVSVGVRKCVKVEQWREEFAQKMGNDEAGSDAFRSAWKRVRSDSGRPSDVKIEGDWAWIEEFEEKKNENF
jgi:hypothetical protein